MLGYQDEPYLRVGPDGVFENRRSPAVYLNANRRGSTAVPRSADPDAEPDWTQDLRCHRRPLARPPHPLDGQPGPSGRAP